jgi:hypothetical protein
LYHTTILCAPISFHKALFFQVIDDDSYASPGDKDLFSDFACGHWTEMPERLEHCELRLRQSVSLNVFGGQPAKGG